MTRVPKPSTRRALLALVALLAVAAVLRTVGIHRGDPELHVDETILVQGAGAALEGVPPDCVLGWPATTQMTLLSAVFAGDLAVRRGPAILSSLRSDTPLRPLDEHYAEFYRSPGRWFLMFRVVTVLFGLLTVYLAFRIGRRWFGGDVAGLFAAALVATNAGHVAHSHYVLPDVPMTFFWLAATGGLLLHLERPRTLSLFFAPFLAALAVTTKFNALPLLAGITVTVALLPDETGRGWLRRTCVAFAGLSTGLLVGCPWLLTDGAVILKDFLWRNFYQQAVAGRPGAGHGGSGWWFLFTRHLAGSYGLATGLLLVPCLALAALRRTAPYLAVGGILAGYLFLLGFSKDINPKWVMPAMPMIALLGGGLLSCAVSSVARAGRLSHGVPVLAAALLVVAAIPAVEFNRGLLRPLPIEELRRWVRDEVPAGETIAMEVYLENPFPLCREAIEERLDELADRVRDAAGGSPGLPVFFVPALLNEENFELQRLRHLLAGADENGYRVMTFGSDRRLEEMLEAARAGRAGVFVLEAGHRYERGRTPREKALFRAREELLEYLEANAVESAEPGGEFAVYRLR